MWCNTWFSENQLIQPQMEEKACPNLVRPHRISQRHRHGWTTDLVVPAFHAKTLFNWSTPTFQQGRVYNFFFFNTSTLAIRKRWSSVSSVTQSCLTLCDCSTPGLPVHHQLPELAQTHVHWVSDAIQPSHPLSSPYPPALNLSQHQGLFQWVSSSHQVTKVLEFQLQHQSFQPSIIHTFYHVSGNPHF